MSKQQGIVAPIPRQDPIVALTEDYVHTLSQVLTQLDGNAVKQLVSTLLDMKANGGTLYLCGNGGSAAMPSTLQTTLLLASVQKAMHLR